MNKLTMVKNAISRGAGRSGLLVKKYSPEILMTVGVVGVIASTVMACKATLKAEAVVDIAKNKLDKIKEAKEVTTEAEYSEQDYKKDITVTYVQTSVDFIKLYGPAVTLGVASIACILGAHGIMRKRNIALAAAYKAVESSFADYRRRVVEEFGEEKDMLLKRGIKKSTLKVTELNADGTTTEKEVPVYSSTENPDAISQYAKYFDESSAHWSSSPEYNLTYLRHQQNFANDLLRSRGHVFLNEVYDSLGIPRTTAGCIVGWVKGEGDDFIDFGIFDGDSAATRDFVNGYESSILLDFNVAGVIYEKI